MKMKYFYPFMLSDVEDLFLMDNFRLFWTFRMRMTAEEAKSIAKGL